MIFNKIFCLVVFLKYVQSQEWKDPWFSGNDKEAPKVEFGEAGLGYQRILMDENIQRNVTIAFLTYNGKEKPDIIKFTSPNSNSGKFLGAVFDRSEEGDNWELIITIPQDFENQDLPIFRYSFEVLAAKVTRTVYLDIRDIDDETPFIKVLSNPCKVDENYAGKTDCICTITDDDGVRNGVMKYRLIGSGIDKTFEFKNEGELPNLVKEWDTILYTLVELDYETGPLYVFDFEAEDSGGNIGRAKIMVEVQDLPDEPPQWMNVFASQQFPEKEEKIFEVLAIDGDRSLNYPINYKLETNRPDLFSIPDEEKGRIVVKPINRDEEKLEIFNFVLIAYERNDITSRTEPQAVTIIVDDINDSYPEITLSATEITIPESQVTTLGIEIEIHDRDLGDNAIYEVSLGDDIYNQAFQITPTRGYQQWTFSISVLDSKALDYEAEDKSWRKITLQIKSVEITDKDRYRTADIIVHLEDWNDEEPIFEKKNEDYVVKIREDIKENGYIETVFAEDKDEGDTVIHSLTNWNDILSIDAKTGVVRTKIADAFDYERQQVVNVQVQAKDTLGDSIHTTFAQLTIEVVDVNDEKPRISLPSESIKIKENLEDGDDVNGEIKITATDADKTAELKFSIDWDGSYAVKNGQRAKEEHYKGCIRIEDQDSSTRKEADAKLVINKLKEDKQTPDYEKFDLLFIKLVVEDLNQEVNKPGTDSVMLTINIEDINDNEPIFTEGSINSNKRVVENGTIGTPIVTMVAEDEDGPGNNDVRYLIRPIEDTPEDWVDIDSKTGELSVVGTIDADDPPIFTLKYTVTATDGTHDTELDIIINVIDINDNEPVVIDLEKNVPILEKSKDGTLVQKFIVEDKDRDEAYKTPWFRFSNVMPEEQRLFFSVGTTSGEVYVEYKGGDVLNRDYGTQQFTIPVIVGDNRLGEGDGKQHSTEHVFTVTLTDINDQKPIIQTKQLNTQENVKKGDDIGEIQAVDDDEKETDNTKIIFSLEGVKKGNDANKDPPEDFFFLEPDPNAYSGIATLKTNYDLEGYYGTYHVEIMTKDSGTPVQTDNKVVNVIVGKYNFKEPKFIFPVNGQTLYLDKPQNLNRPLLTSSGDLLEDFRATDQQNEKWNIEYSIEPPEKPEDNHFVVVPSGSRAQLQLNSEPDYEKIYEIQLTADCKCIGNDPKEATISVRILFININSEPYFEPPNESNQQFTENTTGVGTIKQLPTASYTGQNEEANFFEINYFIHEDASGCFAVNKQSAELQLVKMLDREKEEYHSVVVLASKSSSGNSKPNDKSLLTVHIEVLDVNDNSPHFVNRTYYGSVKQSDALDKVVRETKAIDLDKDPILTYSIVDESLKAVGEGIGGIEKPFYMNPTTGNIHLNFAVKLSMTGYFNFDIKVVDEDAHEDIASVTINVVSESSKASFRFENNVKIVREKESEIRDILEDQFKKIFAIDVIQCAIEVIQEATDEKGATITTETDVFVHFIDGITNEPLAGETIHEKVNVIENYVSLKGEFLKIGLVLKNDVPPGSENEESYLIWLIAVSAILGTLCVALIIAYIIKTRSLIIRLNKLSTTQFGSQESGLNRLGVAAPNTNKHAIEGSNPVYNEEKKMPEIDTASIGSGDSDLIGVEDDPNFQYAPEIFNEKFDSKFK